MVIGSMWITVGNNVYTNGNYFKNNSIYSSIKDVSIQRKYTSNLYSKNAITIDEEFIEIPKFYFKYDDNTFWISPIKEEGFSIHPAFICNNEIMDSVCIGKYQSIVANIYNKKYAFSSNKVFQSDIVTTSYPSCDITFDNYKSYCNNRNTPSEVIEMNNGKLISPYHMININELSMLQLLSLIELRTYRCTKCVWQRCYQ